MAPLVGSDHGAETSTDPVDRSASTGKAPSRRQAQRALAWALSALLPLSVLPLATVHTLPRLILAAVGATLGALALGLGGSHRGQQRGAVLSLGLGLAAALVAAFSLVPLPAGLRAVLQPRLASVIGQSLDLSGHGLLGPGLLAHGQLARPLALDPSRGLVEWAVFVAMILVVGGTAAVVRNRPRARRLAMVVVLTGAACAALGVVQRWTDLNLAWLLSGLPRTRDLPAFATFIDSNHAGILMAAGGPLAVALLRDRRATTRLIGGLGVLSLLVGTLLSGSRGAVVLMGLGLVVTLALSEGARVRRAVAVVVVAAVLGLIIVGPAAGVSWLTGALDPSQQATVAAGYGDLWGGRAQLYRNVWQMVDVAPWVGVGPAGFDDAWRVLREGAGFTIADHAHQELLQVIIEHGLLATGLALAAAGVVLSSLWHPTQTGGMGQRRLQAGFAGALSVIVAASLYEFPLRAGALSTLAALSAGAMLGLADPLPRSVGLAKSLPRLRRPAALAVTLWGLCLGAVVLATVSRASDQTVYADPDRAIQSGRAVLAAAKIDRADGFVVGGDADALAQAAADFQEAIWRRPVGRIALQELSRVRYRQGQADDAETALVVATEVYPTLPWPWADLARLRRARGDDMGAWDAWSVALAFDLPPDFAVRSWVADALQGPGGPSIAALAALPPRADRWIEAARLLEAAGDLENSEILFREAMLLDPDARAQYAFALVRWARPSDVLDLLPAAVGSCGELRARGQALRELARCEEAVEVAEQALLSCGSEERPARILVARARLCVGDERGIGILQALLREDPKDVASRRSLAVELARRGRSDEALEQLEILHQAGQLKPADQALERKLRR